MISARRHPVGEHVPTSTEASSTENAETNVAGGGPEPRWLRITAYAAAATVAGFGSSGLALAIVGAYRPVIVGLLGSIATLALIAVAWPALARPTVSSRPQHLWAIGAVVLVIGVTAWNGQHVSHHIQINRDGGSYTNTGRWIADHGSLRVSPRVGAFADRSFVFAGAAVYEMADGTLEFQFAHLLPALLAEARSVGGDDLMFRAPALLSGVALLAFFVLAWRLIGVPKFALAATIALAFTIPQVSFSRDTVSEIPTQVLVFTALWLLTTRGRLPSMGATAAAGLLLGLTQAVRIDALILLMGFPLLGAIAWLRSNSADRRGIARRAVVFAATLVPGVALGYTDLILRSGHYWTDLSGQTRSLLFASGLVALSSVVIMITWPRIRSRVPVRAPMLAAGATVAMLLVGFGAWIVRPHLQTTRNVDVGFVPALQALEGLQLDATRGYYEFSMHWMAWYLGPITVAAAIVGAALLLRAFVLGRRAYALPVIACLAPGTVLYLYNAKAFSDQVWVMRRFLVGAIPLFILLAASLAGAIAKMRWRGHTVLAVGLAFAMVAYPVWTVIPVRDMTEQRGFLSPVLDACQTIGDDAAVVMVGSPALAQAIPQALRSWCGAEVAVLPSEPDAITLERLAQEWSADGRDLWVIASRPESIQAVLPTATPTTTPLVVNNHLLEATIARRPDGYTTQGFSLSLARVPVPGS